MATIIPATTKSCNKGTVFAINRYEMEKDYKDDDNDKGFEFLRLAHYHSILPELFETVRFEN
jgi:hypothetical protein